MMTPEGDSRVPNCTWSEAVSNENAWVKVDQLASVSITIECDPPIRLSDLQKIAELEIQDVDSQDVDPKRTFSVASLPAI
jgi:hypothetical protein